MKPDRDAEGKGSPSSYRSWMKPAKSKVNQIQMRKNEIEMRIGGDELAR